MTSPGIVLYRPTSRQSLKIGAAIAICGNVEIDSTIARIRNLRFIFSRASAYAQNEPTMSDSAVVTSATIALFFSDREVRVAEDRVVVVERRAGRNQRRRGEVRPRLERRVEQPVEREQAEHDDREDGDPQPPRRALARRPPLLDLRLRALDRSG